MVGQIQYFNCEEVILCLPQDLRMRSVGAIRLMVVAGFEEKRRIKDGKDIFKPLNVRKILRKMV